MSASTRPSPQSRPSQNLLFLGVLTFAVGVLLLTRPVLATILADHACVGVSAGCGTSYVCTASAQVCDPGIGGVAKSKVGNLVPISYCASKPGFTCNQVSRVCFQENHWVGTACDGVLCTTLTNTAAGCY